jgi:hypothetical protein
MDDLRVRIWDYLYRLGRAEQISIIAEQMGESPQAIEQAVDDPWFSRQEEGVAVAHTEPK